MELLVVIGIIALLMSILVPTLSKARESGRRTTCLSNLRQLAAAVLMYANEKKGLLPGPCNAGVADPATVNANPSPFTAGEVKQQLSSNELLQPYLKFSRAVWLCPSNQIVRDDARALSNGRLYNMCYKVNNQPDTREQFFFGSWTAVNSTYQKEQKRLSMVRNADNTRTNVTGHSTIWMISDLDGRNFTTAISASLGITDSNVLVEQRPFQPQHKSGRIGRNYVFFDGHAEWLVFNAWPLNP